MHLSNNGDYRQQADCTLNGIGPEKRGAVQDILGVSTESKANQGYPGLPRWHYALTPHSHLLVTGHMTLLTQTHRMAGALKPAPVDAQKPLRSWKIWG
jgi:hypothetical protein